MTDKFRPLLKILRGLGLVLGRINTVILLGVSYYVILLPLSLIRRLFTKPRDPGGWLPREELPPDHFKNQY